MRIDLTIPEIAAADAAGHDHWARRRNSKHRWNRTEYQTLEAHIDSKGAEIAAGRATNRPWKYEPFPDHDGDLGPGVQVRWTPYPSGRLLVHPEDEDDHAFILVTGTMPTYWIRGYLMGADAKRDIWWTELQSGRPCWAASQKYLRDWREMILDNQLGLFG